MFTIIPSEKQIKNLNYRSFSIKNLYLSLYRSSFDLSLSPLGRFSSGVELRDEWSSGVALRLDGGRPLPVLFGTGTCGGKCPGGKPCTGGPAGL
jgi:hypothetical protein